jgi:hypothetical protein
MVTDPEFAGRVFADPHAELAKEELALAPPERDVVEQWLAAGSMPALQAKLAAANLSQTLFMMERARKLQTETLELFTDTLKRAKGTFGRVTLMNQVLFAIGAAVFVVAAVYGLVSKEKISVAFGGLGGLAAFGAIFLKDPIDRTQAAFSNLVQGEAAFMNFYEQITIWDGYVAAAATPGPDGRPAAGVALDERIEKASEMLQQRTAETMKLLQEYLEPQGGKPQEQPEAQ